MEREGSREGRSRGLTLRKVFDVTAYVPVHKGGQASLLRHAGKECSRAVHGPQHPPHIDGILKKFRIGSIVQAGGEEQ